MAGEPRDGLERFYFTPEQLANSPSRRCGMDADQELQYRQRAANLIQDMGQRLHVSQLCINTAIVYMHRFYAFHSFTNFHRNSIAQAALFLAAKVEEQPRKLEHVIKVAHLCLNADPPDPSKEGYQELAQDLVFNENVLLQILGFEVAIDHPHTHVVKTCRLVKASKELTQTSYFMASNSLHLTTMCLQYKPTVVACFCIHLACKWSRWEIPQSTEGKHWFQYVDKSVTESLLKQLTDEFLHIFDRCPTRLKRLKTLNNSINADRDDNSSSSSSSSHHKSGHHSGAPHHQQKLASSIDHKSSQSSSSRSSSSNQMPRATKMDRPSSSSHNYMQGLPNSSGVNSDSNKMMPPNMAHSMRPPSQSSSGNARDGQQQQPQFVKQRTSSSGLPQMLSKERQHMNSNGNMPPNVVVKHEKPTKMHPATIGVSGQNPTDNLMRKSHSANAAGSNKHLPPSSANYNHQKHSSSSGSRMPPHMKQPGQQLQPQQQQHSTKSQPLQQQLSPQQTSTAPSFPLLDDPILSSEPLKTSPTDIKPKSIFSPDYTPSSTAPILTPQLNPPSVAPHPSRLGANSSMKNINNNNNGSNMYNKKHQQQQQQPTQLLLDNHVHGHHLDFLKQEKISPEPPQQLLASTPVKSDTKKRPFDDDSMVRDTKMRRLEARFEGLPMHESMAEMDQDIQNFPDVKPMKMMGMINPPQPSDIQFGGVKNIIPDTLKARALVPKMEREEPKPIAPLEKKLLAPIVNGGSDADVISSLLKESIYNDNNKSHTILAPLRPPTVIETPAPSLGAGENVDAHHRKSEKKKKKDKHKHKDRSKDREEKKEKKHKKDKDRHRDRSRERESSGSHHHQYHANNSTNHHLSLQSQSQASEPQPPHPTGSLKIKIPKEKITRLQDPPAPLKIKIPKQKISDYL